MEAVPTSPPRLMVVGAHFCLNHASSWTLPRGFASQGEGRIADSKGRRIFALDRIPNSLRERKRLVDSNGNSVCCWYYPSRSVRNLIYIGSRENFDPSEYLAMVQPTFATLTNKFRLKVFLFGNQSGEPDYEVAGSKSSKCFSFTTPSGESVAVVNTVVTKERSWLQSSEEEYQCVMAPGVDIAFVAMVLCYMDDIFTNVKGAPQSNGNCSNCNGRPGSVLPGPGKKWNARVQNALG